MTIKDVGHAQHREAAVWLRFNREVMTAAAIRRSAVEISIAAYE
jgi:hypothetical protein